MEGLWHKGPPTALLDAVWVSPLFFWSTLGTPSYLPASITKDPNYNSSLSLCQWLWRLLNDGEQRPQRAWMLEAWRALAMWNLLRKSEEDSVFSVHLYQLRWRWASWLELCTDPRKCCGLWGNAGSPGIACPTEETGWLCSDILRDVLRKSTHQTLSLVKWQKMLLWLEAAAGNV